MSRFDRAFSTPKVQLIHARRATARGAEHAHDQAMLFVPLAGSLRFAIAGETLVADPEHALAIRARTPHRHEPSEDIEYFIAYVDDALVGSRARTDAPAYRFANTAFVRELAGELLADLAAPADERDAHAIAAATLLLCVQATRSNPTRAELAGPLPDDERLARAIRLARARYRQGVTPKELAKAAGMSPRSLERALVRACGTTPRRLVEELRLADARDRLAAGRDTVTAVAFDLGYKSLSHFVRRFRAVFGTTPTALSRSVNSMPR